ncbi:MAG: pyridoxal phosphate-dependent aminotransferase [Ardenticatenaceae bacterium]
MPQHHKIYPSLAMDEIVRAFTKQPHHKLTPIHFAFGQSSFNPFEFVKIQLTHTMLGNSRGYGEMKGLMSLREAICRYYQERFDYDLSPERIIITDGASGGLVMAMAWLLSTGGELILAESCFPAYRPLATMFNAQCKFAPLNDTYTFDIEALAKLISPKSQAILVNSPSNPHGAVLNAEELAAISSLGVPVVFDEVYQTLPLTDQPVASAIEYSDQHFIVNSFSKSLAVAGFRVGYLIVPESHTKVMTNLKAVVNVCTNRPNQVVIRELFNHWDHLLAEHRKMLTNNWQIFKQTAHQLGLNMLLEPQAGIFGMIDTSQTGQDSMQIALELARDFALTTAPGIDFQDHNTGFLRLNFAGPTEQIAPGLHRLKTYLAQF